MNSYLLISLHIFMLRVGEYREVILEHRTCVYCYCKLGICGDYYYTLILVFLS